MVHHVRVTGQADVPRLLKRHRLLHAVASRPGTSQMRLTSVVGLGPLVAETTLGRRRMMLGVTGGAVGRRRERDRRRVAGGALHLGMPRVTEGHRPHLGVAPHRPRESRRDVESFAQLGGLMTGAADCLLVGGVMAALTVANGANGDLAVTLAAAMAGRAHDV